MEEKFTIPKFNGKDYAVWKIQMKSILIAKDLGSAIENEIKAEQDVNSKDAKARALLFASLDNKHVKLVMQCTTAKQIWDRLSEVHEQRSSGTLVALMQEFFNLRMRSDETVQDFVARTEYVAGQLSDIGSPQSESTVVGKIISGLPARFRGFRSSWMGVPIADQNLKTLLPRLIAEETMLEPSDPRSSALYSGNKQKQSGKLSGKKEANKNGRNTCNYCKQEGHWVKDCPKSRHNKKRPHQPGAAIISAAHLAIDSDHWCLDSGATEHMTFDKSELLNYIELEKPKEIAFGGGHIGLG